MFKKENRFLWILAGALVLCVLVGLLLDPSFWGNATPTGEYHIQISEICAKNDSIIPDNTGKYRDYIELHNIGDKVDLTGCRLTDGNVRSQPFENLIMEKDSYRVIFLSKETTGFALSATGGDSIQLQDPNGRIIAQAKVRSMLDDQVMILKTGAYQLSSAPTPGFSNDNAGREAFQKGAAAQNSPLQLSEILIANRICLPDELGQYSDVVELHNTTDKPLHLGGWCLSDDFNQRFRFRLPEVTLPADGYITIHCDGEGYVSDEGFIHAGFSLRQEEELCLTDPQGNYTIVRVAFVGDNISQALNGGNYEAMAPSLGHPNTEQGCYNALQERIDPQSPLQISELLLSDSGVPYNGTLQDAVEVVNITDRMVNTRGWYLSDGSDPYACPLPAAELAPGACIAVPISKQTAGFGLSVGETVYLTGPSHKLSGPVDCVAPQPGKSLSLIGLNDPLSYNFTAVTMGFPNLNGSEESFLADQLSSDLRISEVMSANTSYLRGPYGNTTDWVELYNAGKETIDLSGYCLADSSELSQYPLPNKTLAPGKYMVILLSETGKRLRSGYSWLPFNLSSAGDKLYLTKEGRILDFVVIPELDTNAAWGRPNGKLGFTQLSSATPGASNAGKAKISAAPTASVPQGAYDGVEQLSITLSAPGTIYYTTDCSEPTRFSRKYSGPINLKSTTVLRVAAYESGCSRSQVVDLTYVLNQKDSLSVVSLVTESENLWDYNYGIYVTGPGASTVYPYQGANYWKNWEKAASVTLFEEDGTTGFSEKCGLKIFGGYSRANGKKSMACMFRGKYGASSLDYALFGEKGINNFQSFVLRAGGQDAYTAKMRDEVVTSIASDYLGLPVQRYRPVALYLNGEYWGIYFIREKLTDQYVAGNFGVEAEEVTLSNWTGGDCPKYKALQEYARNHDLSNPKHYDYICSQINMDNYIDYMITQMWIANTDLGNVKFFRTDDMPWHWALFDADLSFRRVSHTSVTIMMTRNIYKRDIRSATLLIRLMENKTFKEAFLKRTAWVVNNVWNAENVIRRIDEIQSLLEPDMKRECSRWGSSVDTWKKNVQSLRNFASKRNDYFIADVKSYFHLSDAQMRSYGFEV